MPRFFMRLSECGIVTDDEEGYELADLAAAFKHATIAARDVMSAEVKEGRLCLSCHIVIVSEAGDEIGTLPFREALTVSGL